MNRFLPSIIAILLAGCLPIVAQAKAWRGLVPLRSTRADVERLLGKPGQYGRYQFDRERAYINFAGPGPCNEMNSCLCLVSEDTIVSIFIELEVEMLFSRLGVDKKKYIKQVSPQDPNLATYSNRDAGIIYTVNQAEDDVLTIEYLPTASACKQVKRKNRPSKRP